MKEPKVGMTIKIHPCMDLFMRGVKFATIEKIGQHWLTIRGTISGTQHRVSLAGWGVTIAPEDEEFQ